MDHRSCELEVFFEGNKEYDLLRESFPECTGGIQLKTGMKFALVKQRVRFHVYGRI